MFNWLPDNSGVVATMAGETPVPSISSVVIVGVMVTLADCSVNQGPEQIALNYYSIDIN